MIIPPEYFSLNNRDDLLEIYESRTFDDTVLKSFTSDKHNIKIVENEIGRFIMFDETYQAGLIDTQFYKGNIPYINYFLLSLNFCPKPENILLIGMGSGKLAADFNKYANCKRIDIVDVDPFMFEIAREYFGFKKQDNINLIISDGVEFVKASPVKYDIIIVDTAGNDGLLSEFCEIDFLKSLKNILTKKGILMQNLFSSADFASPYNLILKSFAKTYMSVFKDVKLIKSSYSDEIFYQTFYGKKERLVDLVNAIFIASKSPLETVQTVKDFKNYANDVGEVDFEYKSGHVLTKEFFERFVLY
ncbi:MAG: hypothetical protein PHX18_07325 [Candidatus Gastranaerophilales bacterium]|nr:hypothetical protein [Candidatus Gastranaerophilales bacterium]